MTVKQVVKGGPLSISFGIETMRDIPVTAEELIRRADEKMYKSKKEKSSDI